MIEIYSKFIHEKNKHSKTTNIKLRKNKNGLKDKKVYPR